MVVMMRRWMLAAAVAGVTLVGTQAENYDVQTINFDLWCQETQHLPADRCDKRTPADEQAFEDYRAKDEKYEIPYLQGKENGAQLNRTILHSDPIDNPVDKDPSAAAPAAARRSTSPPTPPKPAQQKKSSRQRVLPRKAGEEPEIFIPLLELCIT